MWSILRRIYWLFVVVLISGCSGGGCSGCAGGAVQPIPGGYPLTPDTRIPRAAQIRLTETGLRRVEAIAPGLLGGFVGTGIPVPRSVQNVSIIGQSGCKAIVCPDNNCRINVSLPQRDALRLSFVEPNRILARARIQASGDIPVRACCGINCSDSCGGICFDLARPTLEVRTERGGHPYLGLSTSIAMRRDTHPPRMNYHRADLVSPTGMGDAVQQTMGEEIETDDIRATDSWLSGILNLLRSTLIGQFSSQFASALGPIQDALAQRSMPNPPGCPTGTTARGDRCVYSDMTPVPMLLGTDGQGNLGALLSGFSPGVRAPVRFVLASGDPSADGQVRGGGMTLNFFGAMQSSAHNACVPRVMAPSLPQIPEWQALRANTVPGTTTPIDLGIGLSEDYLGYSLFHLWDAGMFCLGAGTSLSQMLNAGTFSSLPPLNSLRNVIFPGTNGPIAIVLRPQQPPQVRIGRGTTAEPLLNLQLPRLALDFYAWSEERYVRFMTVTTDVGLPLNLQVEANGLRPVIPMTSTGMGMMGAQIQIANTSVSNTQLLSANPALIGPLVQSVLQAALGPALGGLDAFDLPSIPIPGSNGMPLGNVRIVVPSMGVQGVTEGSSRFLGIFANLEYMPAARMPDSVMLDTTAHLDGVRVDPAFFTAEGFREENLPAVSFRADTPNSFGRAVEYSFRIDRGTWSPFSTDAQYTVRHWLLASQGSHTVQVRARMAGEPTTADEEPAELRFDIDTYGPELTARVENGEVIATARDQVSARVEYSFSFDGAPATAWGETSRASIPAGARTVTVTARDASGNESRITTDVSQLIRGGPSTDAGGGCGCTAAGQGAGSARGLAAVMLGALLAMVTGRRRRTRAMALGASLSLGAALVGCADSSGGNSAPPVMCQSNEQRCPSRNVCLPTPSCDACMPGFAASSQPTFNMSTCAFNTACTCERLPPLEQGAVGSHLHMAAATDGALWFSAYSPGFPGGGAYGDLVLGRWNATAMSVDWTIVDGVPAQGTIGGDTQGWRGGVSDPGDDVGQFNSIALDASGNARIAYWDATHNKLKFAACMGTTCTTHTVDNEGSNGRYASLVLLQGGVPAIAYRAAVPTMDGFTSVVRLARASSATPARSSDWTVSTVASLPSACRAGDCAAGQMCIQQTGRCGTPAMGQTAIPANFIEAVPPGALFINLAVDSMNRLSVVWYNRDRGNLMLAQENAMGRFGAPVILDGEGAMQADTGDRGIYATAVMARDNTLHVAYVDGWEERLLYLRVQNGMRMGEPEVIDDGNGVGAMSFEDGRHIVGDSVALQVAMDGTVRAAYQDTTQGTLRGATRGMMTWTRQVLDPMNHTGYWATIAGGNVACWWRDLTNAGMLRWGVRVFPLR